MITGFVVDFSGNNHGFLRNEGQITAFDVPGGSQTTPESINLYGVVTGSYYDATKYRGFMYDTAKDKFTEFDVPGSASTYPVAISIKGHDAVTGYYYPSSGGNYRGFVRLP